MAHEDMTRVDRYLWERMQQLDEPMLTAVLGEWLSDREISAVLERRDRMGEIIDALADVNGEAAVLVRYGVPPGAATAVRAAPVLANSELVDRLLVALSEAPIIAPSSELTWTGTVVALDGYRGRYARIAEAGVRAGDRAGAPGR